MPLPSLDGSRLSLRPAHPGHLDLFVRLNGDAVVMKHVAGRPSSPIETETEWVRRLGPRTAVHQGLGYWVGYVGADPVGWWGLGHDGTSPGAGELGFRVLSERWRRGLGAEGAGLMIDHAFLDLDVARVWAGTVTTNTASRRTLTAVGMVQIDGPRPDVLTYEITRPKWMERRGG